MLIYARYENGNWAIDETQAILVPEFRNLLVDDTLGVKAMAFVSLFSDPLSFLYKIYPDKKDREKEALRSIYGGDAPASVAKDAKVKEAVKKYETISHTPEVKLREQVQNGILKAGDYIAKSSKTLTDDNIKKFMDTLSEMPSMIDSFADMNKGKRDNVEETKKIVRGGRELSYREIKKRGKK